MPDDVAARLLIIKEHVRRDIAGDRPISGEVIVELIETLQRWRDEVGNKQKEAQNG